MITHLDVSLPADDALRARLAERTRGSSQHWADAVAVTNDLFGHAASANIFVVGMAVQAGALPIAAERIERAIGLNGVAVEANRAAFAWGRAQVAAPEAVDAARRMQRDGGARGEPRSEELPAELVARIDALGVDADLGTRLRMFASELIAWQDESIAEDWLDVCERVAAAERDAVPSSTRLVGAVAAGLFKLTAYKDEYEVARLMLDDDAMADARALAGDDGVITWQLHPPMLRALGFDSKIGLGPWATPMIRVLAAQRRLRGTALDPFGRSEVRRIERELAREYVVAIDRALEVLSADSLDAAVAIAELPDNVRGYEEIKLANVAEYRRRLEIALGSLPAAGE
jgi:indolepyruvate ferredoxin oxidoreductase